MYLKNEVITKKKDNSLLNLLDSIIDKAKGSIFLFICCFLVLLFVESVILTNIYSYVVTNVLPGNEYGIYTGPYALFIDLLILAGFGVAIIMLLLLFKLWDPVRYRVFRLER